MKWAWISYGIVWLSMALVVAVCIYFTHRIAPMWFMLFPLFISIRSSSGGDGSKEDDAK